jgi:phospholipid/cholesterol/gamma-HCH transport system permease protein
MDPTRIPVDQAPQFQSAIAPEGHARVVLSGDWTLLPLRGHFEPLGEALSKLAADARTEWDLRGVDRLDSAGALTLWRAWGEKAPARLKWLPEQQAAFAGVSTPLKPPRRQHGPYLGLVSLAGASALRFLDHVQAGLTLLGQLALDVVKLWRHPRLIAWREISANIYRAGAQAMGITALVGFLVGVTLSYLTAKQLKTYGADIFIVNILGISVWRELGPLLAAIIVAGRSGSSMTAQLGVMRVTQELDALSVMGISHTVRLVLPKVLALSISMPLVVVWTSAVVLLGGMVAASLQLGIDYIQFVQGLPAAVPIANLWLGLSKSVVFGALIAMVACHFGLRIQPNTESLGAGTTDSVVTAITVVIIVDAIFAVAFSNVGL